MMTPDNLLYTEEHEWVLVLDDDIAIVGITDYAQDQLGEVVFVDTPEVGSHVVAGDEFGSIESVKASSELYCPVSGEILESNGDLAESPELINQSPYDEGWMIKVKLEDVSETHGLMDHEAYQFHVKRSNTDDGTEDINLDEDTEEEEE